jgi:hypothetical protein
MSQGNIVISGSPTPTSTQPTTSPSSAPCLNISFDHLAPTLSAIFAGIIHHMCHKKEALTFIDFLLILSPSLPVICAQLLKLFAFITNIIGNGLSNLNITWLNSGMNWISTKLNWKSSNFENRGFDEEGRIIFPKYTVQIDISKKMAEWQKEGYHVKFQYVDGISTYMNIFIEKFTKTSLLSSCREQNHFVNFYNEFEINGEKIIFYITHLKDTKYHYYIISKNKSLTDFTFIFNCIFPPKYS